MFTAARADTDYEHMGGPVLAAGLVVPKASAAGSPAVDLRGAAHTGDRPQPDTVVSLSLPPHVLTDSPRRDLDTHRP